MRFKKDKNGDWQIEVKFGPEGLRRKHLGYVDGVKEDGLVYANIYLNYNSPGQIWRYDFFGSVRKAKAWVRDQIKAAP